MMLDLDTILAPLPGENPAGIDMRYLPVYDEIKEARRADDLLDRGEWSRELKTADWAKVFSLSVEALTTKTKDLQLAAWLLEALIRTEGFQGVEVGLAVLAGFLENFWEHVYPEVEDGDLDYRCGPLEFINDKLSGLLKEIPMTDQRVGPGYSWIQWQESVKVGSEADTLDQWGSTDYTKKEARDQLIAEGRLTTEAFAAAVQASSRDFYEQLMQVVQTCLDTFQRLDVIVDEKFGKEAPRISDFKTSLDDCATQIAKILKEKRRLEPDPEEEEPIQAESVEEALSGDAPVEDRRVGATAVQPVMQLVPTVTGGVNVNRLLGSGGMEEMRWQEAQALLKKAGIHAAVELLLGAVCSAQSARERANYQILIAKICLQAKRADLARPMSEQLFAQMEEMQLGRWESPIWIAEVLDLLYQCLTADSASDDDQHRAKEILQRLCTTDVTKAIKYQF